MKTNFQRTSEWLTACGRPSEPSSVTKTSVQIGCQIEEIVEFFSCLRLEKEGYAKMLDRVQEDLTWLGMKFKRGEVIAYIPHHLRVDALDALCDIEVTGNGIAHMSGFDKDMADLRVLDSNDAKLVDGKPVLLDGGKITKPPGWKAPDLTDCV
jgi:predicted HAD superfamily Cof-like phosphohydrolase